MAVAGSVALHGVALALVSAPLWRRAEPAPIVRVSLAGGGAPRAHDHAGGRGPMSEAVSPPAAAAPAALDAPGRSAPRVPKKNRPLRVEPASGAAAMPAAQAPGAHQGHGESGDAGAGRRTGEGAGAAGDGPGTGGGGSPRQQCVYCPEPAYPMIARRRGWEGTVDVDLALLPDGRVDTARVGRSSGHEVLDAAAVAVAQRSRFAPPEAEARGRIEYRFQITAVRRESRGAYP